MVTRYENDYGDIIESDDGPLVTYADYEELMRSIDARTITDCKLPARIENIEAFTPKQVEDMWVHRVKWLCDHLGVKVHD